MEDTDCKYDRICVGGEGVSPPDAGGDTGDAAPTRADQKRAARTWKCEHEQSKCHSKVRDAEALDDASETRTAPKGKPPTPPRLTNRAGDRGRTGDVQLGKLAFYR